MALTTLAAFKVWASISSSTDDATYSQLLAEVEAALKRRVRQNIESASYTSIPLDAPPHKHLTLPERPVQLSGLAVYYNPTARGEVAAFTSDHLLVHNRDYRLVTDPNNASLSRSGVLVRLTRSVWGLDYRYPPNCLAPQYEAESGAVLATWTAGYSSVPADLVLAVHLGTAALFQRRKYGAVFTSESLTGYSRSLGAGPATADAVLSSPEIAALITPFSATGMIHIA